MRFFEYEAREIVKRAGIPVTDFGFATDRRGGARDRGTGSAGPTVIKSQVLTGGRMKAGGVQFADTPTRPPRTPRTSSSSRSAATCRAACSWTRRPRSSRSTTPASSGTALRKQPLMIFSAIGGIDIEQVAEEQPDKVGRRHFSNLQPFCDYQAKQVIASTGVTGRALTRLTPILARLARLFVERRHDARRDQPARASSRTAPSSRSTRTWRWRTRRVPRQQALLDELGVGRRGDARGARADRVRAGRRGGRRRRTTAAWPGNVTEFHGDLGLVIGAGGGSLTLTDAVRAHGGRPANYCEIGGNPSVAKAVRPGEARAPEAGRGEDRGDDVDRLQHPRGHRRARRDQGLPRARARTRPRRSRSSASRAPGRRRASRSSTATAWSTATAPCRCTRPRGAPWRRSRGPRREHPHRRRTPPSSSRASPAARP